MYVLFRSLVRIVQPIGQLFPQLRTVNVMISIQFDSIWMIRLQLIAVECNVCHWQVGRGAVAFRFHLFHGQNRSSTDPLRWSLNLRIRLFSRRIGPSRYSSKIPSKFIKNDFSFAFKLSMLVLVGQFFFYLSERSFFVTISVCLGQNVS